MSVVDPVQVVARYLKVADLAPPLGYPGGSCHLMERIREEVRNPSLREVMVDNHQNQEDGYARGEERAIYDEFDEGPIRGTSFKKVLITPHTQYRMDLRGVTLKDLARFFQAFQQEWNKDQSKGNTYWTRKLEMRGKQQKATLNNLTVAFRVLNFEPPSGSGRTKTKARIEVMVHTAFWKGRKNPSPVPESSCQGWEGWSKEYPSGQGLDRLFPKRVAARYADRIASPSGFMSEYKGKTWDNPLDPRMRVWSFQRDGEDMPLITTEIEASRFDGEPAIWLKALISPQKRGTGMASSILKMITAMADKHDTLVYLTAKPMPVWGADNLLSTSQLKSWYKRNGWVQAQEYGDMMVRYPKGKTADLSPPLGFPGGPCQVIERIDEEIHDPGLRDRLVDQVEDGTSLSNSNAAKVYELEAEPGVPRSKFKKILITPHAQYRMDQRGITVGDLRVALMGFAKAWNDARSTQSVQARMWEDDMAWGEKIEWVDPRIGLQIVFTASKGTVRLVTAFWKGQSDPRPVDEESCGVHRHAGGAGDCYEANGRYFMNQAVSPGSDKGMRLVHGEVTGQGSLSGVNYGHAWIEDGNTVLDKSNGRNVRMPKDVYYALGQIDRNDNIHVYKPEEFRRKVMQHEHWGPWDLRTSTGL